MVVLTGRSGCGKTTAAIDLYRSLVADQGPEACMLVAPNAQAVNYLRKRLLDNATGGAIVGAQINTFFRLASAILAGSRAADKRISPFQRHLLLAGIVGELLESKKLKALGAVADTPGLVIALDRAISELKRAAVDPDILAPSVKSGAVKERDLLEIYRCYQDRLKSNSLFDAEGQIWLARDCLASALGDGGPQLSGLDAVKTLIVDGFTDFT
ncbi:MAG: AAA family ATPase, partial [bacterium]|nr:AAA family ATPase [bacterium]